MGRSWGLATVLLGCMIFFSGTSFAERGASYLDLNLQQNRYLGGVQHSAQTSNYTLLAADLNLEHESKGLRAKLNPVGQGAFEFQDELYFGVPEAYIEPRRMAPGFSMTVGREKRHWSRVDEEFNLGIWQPQLRWDYLNPVQQGLTGLFFDLKFSESLNVTLFTSPVSIPDQGPQFKLREGRFESSNRWFVQPQSRLQMFQGTRFSDEVPLYFELDKPAEEEMIMHSSFGMAVNYKPEETPFFVQASYAYKPRNQIHLGIECANCVNIGADPAPVEITALIHPKIVKHHVATLEGGFNRVDDQGWVSVTGDVPNSSGMPESYEEAPLNKSIVAGIGYRRFIRGLVRRPSWIGVSYMRMWEFKEKRSGGLVPDDQVESSLDRYKFEQVAAFDWTIQLTQMFHSRLNLRNRYQYSLPEKGGWLSSGLEWEKGPVTMQVGVDILGSDVDPNSTDAGLYSRYRSNDRVFAGMNYVF